MAYFRQKSLCVNLEKVRDRYMVTNKDHYSRKSSMANRLSIPMMLSDREKTDARIIVDFIAAMRFRWPLFLISTADVLAACRRQNKTQRDDRQHDPYTSYLRHVKRTCCLHSVQRDRMQLVGPNCIKLYEPVCRLTRVAYSAISATPCQPTNYNCLPL